MTRSKHPDSFKYWQPVVARFSSEYAAWIENGALPVYRGPAPVNAARHYSEGLADAIDWFILHNCIVPDDEIVEVSKKYFPFNGQTALAGRGFQFSFKVPGGVKDGPDTMYKLADEASHNFREPWTFIRLLMDINGRSPDDHIDSYSTYVVGFRDMRDAIYAKMFL